MTLMWIDSTGQADLQEAMAALSQPSSLRPDEAQVIRPYVVGENYALHERAMWLSFEITPTSRSEDALKKW